LTGWVTTKAQSLIGGPVTTTKPLTYKDTNRDPSTVSNRDGSYPTAPHNTLDPTLVNSNSSASAQIPANSKKGTLGQEAAAWAETQIGGAYVWGGGHDTTGASAGVTGDPQDPNAPNEIGFDCSGLVGWAWSKCGPEFDGLIGPTGTQLNSNVGQRIAGVGTINQSLLKPGDLIFYGGTEAHPAHVVMYSNYAWLCCRCGRYR
jgi:cell wall-associated NlpC family hydrolase